MMIRTALRRRASVAAGALVLFGCATHTVEFPPQTPRGHIAAKPGRPGLVVAAPHGTSDAQTGEIAAEVARRTGFGLVVAEGLWKGIPVVAGKVGGIVIQIQDGVSGYLVSSPEECAARCLDLLRDPALRTRMAAAGREHVRENFLITRDLRDQLELVATLAKVQIR